MAPSSLCEKEVRANLESSSIERTYSEWVFVTFEPPEFGLEGGWIDAEAEETKGATIHLFFPTD